MGKDREIKKNHIKFGKNGVLVNFIIQKLKSKHLGSLSQCSLVTRKDVLHIFRPYPWTLNIAKVCS